MGLDVVELVMEIEDEFGISIQDKDAEKLQTMSDTQKYLQNILKSRKKFPCPNQHAFYQIRKALMKTGRFSRNTISPRSETQQFIPSENKHQFWKDFGDRIDLKLPSLALNSKIIKGSLIAPLIVLVIVFCWNIENNGFIYATGSALCSLMVAFIIIGIFLLALKCIPTLNIDIPSGCKTLKEISIFIACRNYLPENLPTDNIWNRLCRVVSEVAGVEEKELKPETSFIHDLF